MITNSNPAIMVTGLRIAIVTSGRFHVGNLARELSRMGHSVAFYSLVPAERLRRFGMQNIDIQSALIPVALWYAGSRFSSLSRLQDFCAERLAVSFDNVVAARLKPCDVFIGMSGIAVKSALVARERWGAKVFIERGSRHIDSQREILRGLPSAKQVTEWQVERELASYSAADIVTVLSRHCEQSFLDAGLPSERVFRNPLGVDFSEFPLADRRQLREPTVVMAGTWCWRKGADLLTRAIRHMPHVRFIHVGSVGDHKLPSLRNFEHIEAVPQRELKNIYARAHVMCLPSREEGMATVLPQALSSGLRIVCSDRTGGDDLREWTREEQIIFSFKSDDFEGMILGIEHQLTRATTDRAQRMSFTDEGREFLSWSGSAGRYSTRLMREIGSR